MTLNYSTRAAREQSALLALARAAELREPVRRRWDLVTDYYEGRHRTQDEIAASCQDAGIPWIAAQSPDVYMHVESQITPALPEFTFHGRDDDLDDERARQREYVVRYLADHTHLSALVPITERRCILCGTGIWKIFWDGTDVRAASIDPHDLYPDPDADSTETCEYLSYVYRISRRAAARIYGADLQAQGVTVEELKSGMDVLPDQALPDDPADDTLPVLEHWFRDDEGKIACSILLSGTEVRFIPDYWRTTGCNLFPFVFQNWVSSGEFWGRTDLEEILPLVDAVDRELASAQLQSVFTGSDIILAESDAFARQPEQRPGAVWELKPGSINAVKRLGDLGNADNRLAMIDSLRSMIQDALGNYDSNLGKEPSKILSATGLAQLLERADRRKASKRAERLRAYENLYRLLDWTALEFYDSARLLRLNLPKSKGHDNKTEAVQSTVFRFDPKKLYAEDGYFPEIDCEVSASDALENSRAFTLSALETILSHTITAENYPLVLAALKTLDLDEANALEEHFRAIFAENTSDRCENQAV